MGSTLQHVAGDRWERDDSELGERDSEFIGVSVTRQELLRRLRYLWDQDKSLGMDVELEDILDDLACLGIDGASDAYLLEIKKRIPEPLTE